MTVLNYSLPPPIYLPSSGGYTSSRFVEDPLHQRVFSFRKYSVDEDGRLVYRTKSTNRELRPKPYDRPQRNSDRSVSPGLEHTTTPGNPQTSRQIDPSAFSQIFLQLVPIAFNEPLAFESKAATICASLNFDSATSADIINSIKQVIRGRETTVPSASGGPTNPESIVAPTAPAPTPPSGTTVPPLMPFKQQRAFTSGPRGFTVWYSTQSSESLSAPPLGLQVSAGMLYIHTNTSTKLHSAWLCDTNGKWIDVTGMDNVKHSTIQDRFLLVRSDGIPSWLTKVDYAAVQARRERAGK